MVVARSSYLGLFSVVRISVGLYVNGGFRTYVSVFRHDENKAILYVCVHMESSRVYVSLCVRTRWCVCWPAEHFVCAFLYVEWDNR